MYNQRQLEAQDLCSTTSGLTFDSKSYMTELDDSELDSLSGGENVLDKAKRTGRRLYNEVKNTKSPVAVGVELSHRFRYDITSFGFDKGPYINFKKK